MLMKKRFLSMLVLLAAVVTGAWAQDYYAPSTDEVIILNDVYDASKSGYSSHSAIAWGGSATVSKKTAGDPNNGGQPTSSTVNCYSVKGTGQGKNITLSITGVSKVIVYHPRGNTEYIELRDGSKNGNIIGSGQTSTFYTEVALTATNKYSIFLHGTGTGSDDLDLYVYAIKLIAAPAATGYSITLDEGAGNKDSQNWEITPKSSELSGGEAVTVKYNGSREVKSVTVVKLAAAAARALAKATAEDLGKIAGADGKIYATKADAEAANTTAVAMIAYVGSDTGNDTYTHGMALALSDEGEMNWSPAKSTCEGKTAVSGAAWLLPSRNQWKAMFKANGGNEGSYTGLNTAVATAGGDSSKLQMNERYWTSSELDADFAWVFVLGEVSAGWDGAPKDLGHHVRACLAF